MRLLNGLFWSTLDFESLIQIYFDYIRYDRVDPRDAVLQSFTSSTTQDADIVLWGDAIGCFYDELENHLQYFFGNNQGMLCFNKLHDNTLVLEVIKHDEKFDPVISRRTYT